MRIKKHLLALLPLLVVVTSRTTAGIASAELMSNGGFEVGGLAGWTVVGDVRAARYSHSGIFSARLGSRLDSGQVSQQFRIPAGSNGKLSFWYLGVPGEAGTTSIVATLLDQNGAVIMQWNGRVDYRWHQAIYDIGSRYSNQTLTLRFLGEGDYLHEDIERVFCAGSDGCIIRHKVILYTVYAYVDDISVTY